MLYDFMVYCDTDVISASKSSRCSNRLFQLQGQLAPKDRTRRSILKEERKVVSLDLSRASTSDTINYKSISEKWQMPEGAIAILKEIQSKPVGFDYNRETDILAFRHPLKTGGTSFSLTLADRFGRERVLPGSAESNWFKFQLYEEALENTLPPMTPNIGIT